eukprot:SAG11_NODE_957_length_6394_cov_4.145512_6_plen_320_part_00
MEQQAVNPAMPEPEPEHEPEPEPEPEPAEPEPADVAKLQELLLPLLGSWFEDKSKGDVSSLGTFLTACGWGWATRPLLTNAPNQMWCLQQHADDGPCSIRIGVEVNALMKKLVSLVGAAPFVRYDCSGAPFEFELFTDVTGIGTVSVDYKDCSLTIDQTITAPEYVLVCKWTYRVVQPASPQEPAEAQQATCKMDYSPSFEGAIAIAAGEVVSVISEPGEDWTKVSVSRAEGEVVGHVPTSFLQFTGQEVSCGGTPKEQLVAHGCREELWCEQINEVFKRAVNSAGLKGEPVPDMDHTMNQVWVRAQAGDGGMLGRLMR